MFRFIGSGKGEKYAEKNLCTFFQIQFILLHHHIPSHQLLSVYFFFSHNPLECYVQSFSTVLFKCWTYIHKTFCGIKIHLWRSLGEAKSIINLYLLSSIALISCRALDQKGLYCTQYWPVNDGLEVIPAEYFNLIYASHLRDKRSAVGAAYLLRIVRKPE